MSGSPWYLTNFGRLGQGVHLFNLSNPSDVLQPLNGSVLLTRAACESVTLSLDGANVTLRSAPAYGKTLAVALDYGAIGECRSVLLCRCVAVSKGVSGSR